jgi:hypothetical protein
MLPPAIARPNAFASLMEGKLSVSSISVSYEILVIVHGQQ